MAWLGEYVRTPAPRVGRPDRGDRAKIKAGRRAARKGRR